MNFDCLCGCGKTLQTGDPYRKSDQSMAVSIFGCCRDGYPTVWLDLERVERLIKELGEYRNKLTGHQVKV